MDCGSGTLTFLCDELGSVRAEIKTLKAREAALREAILDARPNAPVQGAGFTLEVRRGEARRFARDLLPQEVQDNPRYWRRVPTTTVVTRAVGANRSNRSREDDDLEVIERF